RHLGEVRALAAEQVLLLLRALFECVDVLHDATPEVFRRIETTDRGTRRPNGIRQPSTTIVLASRSCSPWKFGLRGQVRTPKSTSANASGPKNCPIVSAATIGRP